MQVALIGLSQSGKSSLFSAITEGHTHSDAGLSHQIDKAIVKVPDHRVDQLTQIYKPKKHTYATIEFLDLPGLSFLEESTRHEARRIVAQARQAAMLVVVVRAFQNDSVACYRDRMDPVKDLEELHSELFFADLEMVVNRIDRLEKQIQKPIKSTDQDKRELALMQRCSEALENMRPLSEVIDNEEEEKIVRSFGFLSLKPMRVVVNTNEDKLADTCPVTAEQAGGEPILLSARLEAELAELDESEREEFLKDMHVTEIARDRLIQMCYRTLNLISFLTVGEDEVRAWTISAGCPAVEAAGEIHSDIERGFIRAETVSYDDFMAAGDMKGVKAAGKARLEGKTYLVQDGDIINFRFNV
jgi:hypothetical protein